jgi:hypothetical protein
MISDTQRATIRRLFFAEHWKVGTIAAELGIHHDAVHHAIESRSFLTPSLRVRAQMLDPYRDFILATLVYAPRGSWRCCASAATPAGCSPCAASSPVRAPHDTRRSSVCRSFRESRPRWTGRPSGGS